MPRASSAAARRVHAGLATACGQRPARPPVDSSGPGSARRGWRQIARVGPVVRNLPPPPASEPADGGGSIRTATADPTRNVPPPSAADCRHPGRDRGSVSATRCARRGRRGRRGRRRGREGALLPHEVDEGVRRLDAEGAHLARADEHLAGEGDAGTERLGGDGGDAVGHLAGAAGEVEGALAGHDQVGRAGPRRPATPRTRPGRCRARGWRRGRGGRSRCRLRRRRPSPATYAGRWRRRRPRASRRPRRSGPRRSPFCGPKVLVAPKSPVRGLSTSLAATSVTPSSRDRAADRSTVVTDPSGAAPPSSTPSDVRAEGGQDTRAAVVRAGPAQPDHDGRRAAGHRGQHQLTHARARGGLAGPVDRCRPAACALSTYAVVAHPQHHRGHRVAVRPADRHGVEGSRRGRRAGRRRNRGRRRPSERGRARRRARAGASRRRSPPRPGPR